MRISEASEHIQDKRSRGITCIYMERFSSKLDKRWASILVTNVFLDRFSECTHLCSLIASVIVFCHWYQSVIAH